MEGTYELDRFIGSPASASVRDIMAASGTRTLTKEASADYREATGEVIYLEGKSHRCDNLTCGAQLQKVFLPPGSGFLRRNFPNFDDEFS